MSRIEESLYNSVSKYGVRVDENINKPSRRSRLTEDLIDDFYDTFDPDGDHESGLMAHDGAELDAWINWLDDHGMDYEMEYSDDPDYEAYVIINESVKRRHRKSINESDYDYEITNKGYGYDKIRAELEKDKLGRLYGNVLYTAKPGEGTVTKLRKEHPNYTIISRENAEKINQIDLHSINGLILDGIEKFPNEVMGKLTTILNDTPIPVVAVTYDKAALDAPVLRGFRFGSVRVGESCDLTEAVNPENEEVNAIIKKYLGKKGMPNKKEQAVLDKYGIKKDEYGRFVGPKGATLYGDRTSVMGPSKPGRTTRTRWGKYRSNSEPFGWFDKSKTGGKYKNPKDVDALDKIDYANYLTKVDPDELRGKNKEWSVDVENEHAMKPYSEPYKDAKKDAKYERRRQQSEIDDILADEKEIERRQRSIERSRENAKKHAENAAKAEQARKDILAKARAKHGKDVDESMSLHEDRVLSDWEANLSEQDRFLYDGITNRLEDAIVAWMKFIRDVEGMTDSEVRNAAAVFLTTEAHNLDLF